MANSDVSPAEIQEKLGGVDYPVSKQDLIDHVEKNGESNNEEVRQFLEELPDKKYNSPIDVTKAVGKKE